MLRHAISAMLTRCFTLLIEAARHSRCAITPCHYAAAMPHKRRSAFFFTLLMPLLLIKRFRHAAISPRRHVTQWHVAAHADFSYDFVMLTHATSRRHVASHITARLLRRYYAFAT